MIYSGEKISNRLVGKILGILIADAILELFKHNLGIIINICDCLSKNPSSSHLPVFQEIPFQKLKNQPCLDSGIIH